MVQPTAVQETLINDLLTQIGLWPRFLLAWPEPAKPRQARPFRPDKVPEIGQFWELCADLLPATTCEECTGLLLLHLTDEAQALLEHFFEAMEKQAKGS